MTSRSRRALSNPEAVGTRRSRVWPSLICICFFALGCTRSTETSEFTRQLRQLRNGESNAIQLANHELTDEDVALLASEEAMRVLQAEHSSLTTQGCASLATLQLQRITLRGSRLTDSAAEELAKIETLQIVNLPQADFSDAGIIALTTLPRLELMRIGSPRAGDAIAPAIASMSSLRFLHLIDVPLTDEGLKQLEGMEHLESLYLDGSRVTHAGLERLIKKLPDLHLHIDQQHLDIDPRRGHDEEP